MSKMPTKVLSPVEKGQPPQPGIQASMAHANLLCPSFLPVLSTVGSDGHQNKRCALSQMHTLTSQLPQLLTTHFKQ